MLMVKQQRINMKKIYELNMVNQIRKMIYAA